MGRRWIGSDRGEQLAVLPLDVQDALPKNHPVWDFLAFTDELDLSGFEAAYRADGWGRPPYDPKMILTLILYCGSKKIRSGRDIAAACYDDLGARVITGNRFPDRTVIDRFLRVHAVAVKELFPQTLRLGAGEDLVDVTLVAGDGTKVVANAAMSATVNATDLQTQITDLEAQLQAAQDEWAAQIATQDAVCPASLFDDEPSDDPCDGLFGGRSGEFSGGQGRAQVAAWRRLSTLRSMLGSRQAALTHLRDHPGTALSDWQDKLTRDRDRATACAARLDAARADLNAAHERRREAVTRGVKIPGPAPVAVEDHVRVRRGRTAVEKATARAAATAANRPTLARVNTTDPSSRIMPGKHDGFDQRYNIQAMACKNQFILAVTIHDSANDKQALTALVAAARDNLDAAGITQAIGTALFDNGYASEANFTAELPVNTLLVSVEKEARQTGRLRDGTTTAAHTWQLMADRLAEPGNTELYKRRAAIIEPLFAQLFTRFGRDVTLRGENVETEIYLWAITHNLLKISRSRHKNRRPG
jgi:transposase